MARAKTWDWIVVVAALVGYVHVAAAVPVTFSGSVGNTITLTGALGTQWFMTNTCGTDNGAPTGGLCDLSPGLGVEDAILDPSGVAKADAFDNGLTLWVDNVIFVSPDTVDVTGQTLTSGPITMSALNVTAQYYAAATTPALRALFSFRNPGATPVSTTVQVLTNVGSDAGTGVVGTSSGDPTFNTVDRWIVTSDSPTTPSDPVVGNVVGGPRSNFTRPLRTPASVSQVVFGCGSLTTNGVLSRYNLTVPPGQTLSLLLFSQLSASNVAGLTAAAASFGTDSTGPGIAAVNPPIGGDLLSGLTANQLLRVVNWDFFGQFDLTGGGIGGSVWRVMDRAGTSDGTPTGTSERTPGLGVIDAALGTLDDAFDNGITLWINDAVFLAPLGPNVTGQTLTSGPVSMSGLDVTLQYAAAAGSATLRTLASFTNPGAGDVSADVKLVTNCGSDSSTAVRGSSSGDSTFTTLDRWVVTSDSPTTPGDPVNIHVVAGPAGPQLPPSGISQTVFDDSGMEGILAEFTLAVPAGQTRQLLFFNGLAVTNEAALAAATTFDTNPASGSDLLAGLAASSLLEVVNWNFCATEATQCDDGSACTDDTCTVGPGCAHGLVARAASFVAVGCRTDALSTSVQGAAPGTIQSALLKKLQAARAQETKAQMFRAAGKKGPAKRAITKAIRFLKTFEKLLRSKKAKAQLTDPQRTAFTSASSDLRTDLTTLKSAP